MDNMELTKGMYMYYAQVMPTIGEYNVLELHVHTVNKEKNYFTGCETKTKHTYLFSFKNIGNYIFFDRSDALKMVKEAEKANKDIKISNEKDYEEY